MPEQDQSRARSGRGDQVAQFGLERRHGRCGNPHVQLEWDAERADRVGVPLPVGPQRAPRRLVGGDGRVEHVGAPVEHRRQRFGRIVGRGAVQQQVAGGLGAERGGQAPVLPNDPQTVGVEHLGGGQARYRRPDRGQHPLRRGGVGHAQHGGHAMTAGGHQAQPHCGQHGQCALAADQGADQVVAGAVLGQSGHAVQHPPVGEHRLEPGHLGPHRTPAQHPQAAGVGGDHAADRGRVPGGEVHGEVQPDGPRVPLHRGQRRAGADGHLSGKAVDGSEAGQPGQAQHDLATPGHAAADQPGVATLRDDGDARIAAGPQHRRHLVPGGRPNGESRVTVPASGPVRLVAGQHVAVGQDVLRAHQVRQSGFQHPAIMPSNSDVSALVVSPCHRGKSSRVHRTRRPSGRQSLPGQGIPSRIPQRITECGGRSTSLVEVGEQV